MNARLLTAVLLMALPLAGCLDEGADAGTQETTGTDTRTTTRTSTGGSVNATTSAGPGSGNGTGNATGNQTGNATGNQTGNATGNQTGNATGNLTWRYDNRTGTVEGMAIPLLSDEFSKEETFEVANGTLRLVLNLSVDGDDVNLQLRAPDCPEDDDDCVLEADTEDGQATLEPEGNVTAGEWTATLTVSGLFGGVGADYELSIQTLAAAVPGNATA